MNCAYRQRRFPHFNPDWELDADGPASRAATICKEAILGVFSGGGAAPPHKNFPPDFASRLNFAEKELDVAGHWPIGPETD